MSSMPDTQLHDDALATLESADRALDEAPGERLSLCPGRGEATKLVELGRSLLTDDVTPEVARSFAAALSRIATAIAEHFPENIFWDLDYLATVLLEQNTPPGIEAMADRIAALQEGFGGNTDIRFRYAHDFLYGFDWARWVRKSSKERKDIGPFDPEFLEYLDQRRRELMDLIAADDRKYPALRDERHRNPFAFSREPEAEKRLHEAMAAEDLIPVHAWSPLGTREWDRSYTHLRRECAERLQIPVRASSA